MLRSAVSRTTLKAVGQSGLGGNSGHVDGMHPNLGLHNAAATGNIGLVKFALENGQPANSNLNGILPLHAACSGGSEQSVRMLIFHGADVNAPRLKSKGSTGPGAEASTPLHFAAANGHLDIVRILLEAGARPAAVDKDGLVPEALALGNGHTECANLIRSWISAYGSNGLAGMVESRETVSGDVALGPAAYIRYAASGRSNSPLSPTAASQSNGSAPAGITSFSVPSTPQAHIGLNTQASSDTLATNNGSRLAGSRSATPSKNGLLAKTSSNPNLRSQTTTAAATPPLPVASPSALSASVSQAAPRSASHTASTSGFTLENRDSNGQLPSTATTTRSSSSNSTSAAGTSATSANIGASASGSVRESKRRPSLPSILEKAAHPAASLRAALASGSSSHMGGSLSQATSSRYIDHSYDASTTSPGKKHSKLAGKRSLSNMLRKATGGSHSGSLSTTLSPSMPASSSSFLADTSAASSMGGGLPINLDALSKPGRASGKSFDYPRPAASSLQRGARRHGASESSSEDADAILAAAGQPPLPPLDQQRRLRSTSSSSSLSAARDPLSVGNKIRRARAGSNDQITSNSARMARLPLRGNASLDLLRPGSYGPADSQDLGSSVSTEAARIERQRAGSTGSRATANRDRSVSGASTRSADTTDHERSQASSAANHTADDDDLQEFLHHADSEPGDSTLDAEDRSHAHQLPAALRNTTAPKQIDPRDTALLARTNAALGPSGAYNLNTRDRSGSHVSTLSSGSHSGSSAIGVGVASSESHSRDSPSLSASYQALSIAEENGVAASAAQSRPARAPSVADSLTSHASSSSLRSNYLSAAEQAHAILNHDAPFASDGPGGTSASLAAQLAAYGEALALERKRAGDTRSGPSPSLSTRGSNAALRSKLPSVSEDHSPSRSASHSAHSFSAGESRTPNYPATAAQSYNRRVSRRPHSSEGRQTQDAGQRSLAGLTQSSSDRAKLTERSAERSVERSAGTASRGQDGDATQKSGWLEPHGLGGERQPIVSPKLSAASGLGSPMHLQSTQGWVRDDAAGDASESSTATRPASSTTQDVRNSAPAVPPKDQRRRRHGPVTLHGGVGALALAAAAKPTPVVDMDDGDEDDPKTPVLGGSRTMLDKFATSPRSLHRHSPSMPTELSSYTAARRERSPAVGLSDSAGSSTASSTPPVPPPRKESINMGELGELAELGSLGLEERVTSDRRMLTPDSATWSSWRGGSVGGGGEGQEEFGRDKAGSRWEGLRRPSLNMLRSATSSSTHSQTPSQASGGASDSYGHSRWSTDETAGRVDVAGGGAASQPASGGKRGLVRNLINKAKGTAS